MRNKLANSGQTLLELLVALGVGVLIVVALVGAIVLGVKNSSLAKNQSLATKYGQEGLELVRNQRDSLGWPSFYTSFSGKVKCLDSSGNFSDMVGSCPKNISDFFVRSATFVDSQGSGVKLLVTVTVSWEEGGKPNKSVQSTFLTQWQNR